MKTFNPSENEKQLISALGKLHATLVPMIYQFNQNMRNKGLELKLNSSTNVPDEYLNKTKWYEQIVIMPSMVKNSLDRSILGKKYLAFEADTKNNQIAVMTSDEGIIDTININDINNHDKISSVINNFINP